MNQIQIIGNYPLTMSSREIAELTGKEHKNVLADIRKMLEELGQTLAEFSADVQDAYGRLQPAFKLPKRETLILVSGYSVELRARIVDRWQELEAQAGKPAELSRMDILRLALESEEARIKAEEERDDAIRTKALIGSRREATAMATASAAKREASKLRDQLGFNGRHATVIAVEKALKSKFDPQCWRLLKAWCLRNGVQTTKVQDPRWGEATAWPSGAWLDVFGIDLADLFGEVAA